jgi:hypothetical protein
MTHLKRLFTAALLALSFVPAAMAAQATYTMPSTGPMSLGTFVADYLNPALGAALSCNAGSSAPSVSGQPATYQCWIDTSTTPKSIKIYDTASWVVTGYLDTSGHAYSVGGVSIKLLNSSSGTTTITPPASGTNALTLPAGTDTLVGKATTDTLTNKSLSGSSNTFTNLPASALTGVVASANGGAGSISGALKGNGSGTTSQAACADLSNATAACSTPVGTSGATIPLLNGGNTWSGVQSITSGDLALKGASSGALTVNAAAAAGSNTLTLPAGTTDFSATGGTSQVVKQTSAGGALTVARLACSDLSNAAASCSTDATNASNLTGQVAVANGGTGQATALASRSAAGLNIEGATTQGDANKTVAASDRTIVTTATFTAARTDTLPAASAVNPGAHLVIADMAGAINGSNSLTVQRAGSDTINGVSSVALTAQYAYIDLVSDGASKWTYQAASGGGGGSGTVTNATTAAGTGIAVSGTCAITTSGTCTVSLATIAAHTYLGNSSGSSTTPTPVSASNVLLDIGAANALQIGQPVNVACAASVSSNALTITLNGNDGNALSSTNPGYIPFRSATAATGTQDVLTLTSSPTFTFSSGSTAGFVNATAGRVWVVGFNDGSTFRLGAVNARSGTSIMSLGDDILTSSTAEGGTGAADSAQVIYTGTAVSSKGMRILCYMDWASGLTTAGTWASGPTKIQVFGPGVAKPGTPLQRVPFQTGADATGSTVIPNDNTIPQQTEGTQFMSNSITPSAAPNVLQAEVTVFASNSATGTMISALFRDSGANAISAFGAYQGTATGAAPVSFQWLGLAGSTSSTTFKVRSGCQSGTFSFNGSSGVTGGQFGGVVASTLNLVEFMG